MKKTQHVAVYEAERNSVALGQESEVTKRSPVAVTLTWVGVFIPSLALHHRQVKSRSGRQQRRNSPLYILLAAFVSSVMSGQ